MSSGKQFVIGVAGHRKLPSEEIPILTTEIETFYRDVIKEHGKPIVMSPLAEGADTLCAKLALDVGLRLIVPLPMNALEYRQAFTGAAETELDCLLSLADRVFVVPPEETVPVNPKRGFYYRQAGIYVVKHCDILLAVWDGEERDTPDGAGTWETIKLARRVGKPVHRVAINDKKRGMT